MAFTVEDGSGVANANSYTSVADADAYLVYHQSAATWAAAIEAQKQSALIQATRYVESVYGRWYRGQKVDVDFSLKWPRYQAYDDDGFLYDSDTIPTLLVDAVSELALKALSTELLPDVDGMGDIESESVKVGSIATQTKYLGGRSAQPGYEMVDRMLNQLIVRSDRIERS